MAEEEVAANDLYGVPPGDFVATRKRLASALRDAGRTGEARELEQQRKPTLAAWAVNQVVRRRHDDVERLFAVADGLRDDPTDAAGLRDAASRLRGLIGDLRDEAARALEELGSDPSPHLDQVEQSLWTAAVVEADRAPVAEGRLVMPLPAAGFDGLAGLAVSPSPPPASPPEAAPEAMEADADRLRAAQLADQAEQLQGRVARMRQDLDATEREVARLRAAFESAREQADQRRERLRQAQEELAALQAELMELEP